MLLEIQEVLVRFPSVLEVHDVVVLLKVEPELRRHRHLNLEVLLEVLLVALEEEDNFALTSRTTSRSAVVVKELWC